MSILEGAVVFVDDDFLTPDSLAKAFYDALQINGRPVAAYKSVPPTSHLDHWEGISLVVLDWNLTQSEHRLEGVTMPLMAADAQRTALIAFLTSLLDRYFCPVFIVSADTPQQIEDALRASEGFPVDTLGDRIQILQKDADDLLPRLESHVLQSPVLSTLRVWEQQYHRAKNRMFIDLDKFGADWLIYLLQVSELDGTDAGHELVNSLYGNLQHRIDPVAFDFSMLASAQLSDDGDVPRRVVHGQSVLRAKSLYESTIMPGDFFAKWRKSDPSGAIWMNITPACYTVRGRGKGQVRLHLVRGVPEEVAATLKPDALRSKRSKESRSATVDVLHDGHAYKFDFSTLETMAWSTVAKHRLGRLLPPYITNLQQKHATYLMSEGLPAVLPTMYKIVNQAAESPAA